MYLKNFIRTVYRLKDTKNTDKIIICYLQYNLNVVMNVNMDSVFAYACI